MANAAYLFNHQPPEIAMKDSFAERDTGYGRLMAVSRSGRNSHVLASMLANWRVGESVLPARLGLSRESYYEMFAHQFPGEYWLEDVPGHGEFDADRMPERDDLVNMLLQHRRGEEPAEEWLAQIIAAACMGMDHLWQDMGLWSRTELSSLMQRNFPTLAERNDRDMKWKKFLYKQLCEQQGIYVCRSPSCDVCSEYNVCFGSEE
jgi:nitrogen fixation protein NifQ